jgi:hypothetical protein
MKHSSTARGLFMVIAMLLFVGALEADTLVLSNGRRVQGQLIAFQNGMIEFRESDYGGRILRLNRDQVVGIEFDRFERNPQRYPQNQQQNQQRGGRPRGLREKQIMVVANAPWTDTGIDVQSGQNVYFEATGEIRWGRNRAVRPAGEPNSPNNPARPMPNRPGASLIGSLAGSEDYFFLGDDRGPIRMRNSGRLLLGINDDNLGDNTGYFTVIVFY